MSNKKNEFDTIVIGAGSGGLNIASFMNEIGLSVLLVDRSDHSIGGDCLNYGCVPSKALIHASRLVRHGNEAQRFGVKQSEHVDLMAVMEYIRERQEVIRVHENAAYFREKGMTVVLGEARFVGTREIEVAGKHFRGKKIVIATGSRPRTLSIPGSEHTTVFTNETIFNARSLPDNLVLVGGGPIAFEIGQAFARLGSQVSIVNINDQWLGKEHRSVVEPLMKRMETEGVSFISNATVAEVTAERMAVIEKKDGSRSEIACDALFIGIGRAPNTDGLGLEEVGIELDDRGYVVVDPYLRTSNSNVFALGDVIGELQFTHAAELHASTILSNFFKPRLFWKKHRTDHMAWVTYTDPEIATFGHSEEVLVERGESYRVIEQPFSENDRSIVDGRTEGVSRLYISKKGTLLGGTLVGNDAGMLVGELILAQTYGLGLSALFKRVYPYPTASRIHKLAAAKYMRTRLGSGVKRLLRLLY